MNSNLNISIDSKKSQSVYNLPKDSKMVNSLKRGLLRLLSKYVEKQRLSPLAKA